MMKIYENGIYREATEEELAIMQAAQWRKEAQDRTRPLNFNEVLRLTIRQQVNTLDIDDETASRMVDYYPELTGDGSLVKARTKINWHGTLKRAALDLWDNAQSTPDVAPRLWEDIAYKDGIRIIPETITAGAAFAEGELGWWEDYIYKSKIVSNVYTPDQYADGWEMIQ